MNLLLTALPLDVGSYRGTPTAAPYALRGYLGTDPELSARVQVQVGVLEPSRSDEELVNELARAPAGAVGLTCYVWNVERSVRLLEALRVKRPDLLLLLGGPDVAPRARRVLQDHPAIDAVATGEGEEALRLLMRRRTGLDPEPWEATPGFAVRERPDNPPAPTVDLNRSPCLLDDPDFMQHHSGTLVIESSRGCRFACGFCMWAETRRNGRSIDKVVEDIQRFSARGGGRLDIIDAGLNQEPKALMAVMDALVQAGNIEIGAIELNLEQLDDRAAEALAKTARRLAVGMQTTRSPALKAMRRGYRRDRFRDRAAKLTELGLAFQIDLIYGLPGDDHEGFCDSLDEAYACAPILVIPFRLQVLPGSRYERQAEGWGLRYQPTPWYWVLETDTYSAEDIERSTRLALANDLMHTFTFASPAFAALLQARAEKPSVLLQAFLDGGWRGHPVSNDELRRWSQSAALDELSLVLRAWWDSLFDPVPHALGLGLDVQLAQARAITRDTPVPAASGRPTFSKRFELLFPTSGWSQPTPPEARGPGKPLLVGRKPDGSVLTAQVEWEVGLALHHADGARSFEQVVALASDDPDAATRLEHAFAVLEQVGALLR